MSIPKNAQKVFSGKIFEVYQREQEMFDGSKKIFEKLKRNDTIDIVVVGEDEKIYIVEEEQPGREPFYGLVGGTGEDGESPMQTAKRELLEEMGFESDDWEIFGEYKKSSKIDYISHIFIARNAKKVQEQHLDVGEKIKIKSVLCEEFLQIVAHPKFRVSEFALEILREIYLGRETELKRKIFGK